MNQEPSLKNLVNTFAAWRSTKSNGERLPAELLRSAASTAEQFGTTKVAKALGLNGSQLAREVTALREQHANFGKSTAKSIGAKEEVFHFSRVDPVMHAGSSEPPKAVLENSQQCYGEMLLPNGVVLRLFSASALKEILTYVISSRGT